ncbi:MAG: hypothetical protein J7L15_03165, partial [Clostridiales bacterium]|nr:hypothetical protein [Clostridiales bacterium]
MEEIKNEKFKLTMFVIYTIIYEVIVWGIWLYLFIIMSISGWSVIIAMIMSSSQLRPQHFGLPYKLKLFE